VDSDPHGDEDAKGAERGWRALGAKPKPTPAERAEAVAGISSDLPHCIRCGKSIAMPVHPYDCSREIHR
jgi:hypothetical protein